MHSINFIFNFIYEIFEFLGLIICTMKKIKWITKDVFKKLNRSKNWTIFLSKRDARQNDLYHMCKWKSGYKIYCFDDSADQWECHFIPKSFVNLFLYFLFYLPIMLIYSFTRLIYLYVSYVLKSTRKKNIKTFLFFYSSIICCNSFLN